MGNTGRRQGKGRYNVTYVKKKPNSQQARVTVVIAGDTQHTTAATASQGRVSHWHTIRHAAQPGKGQ